MPSEKLLFVERKILVGRFKNLAGRIWLGGCQKGGVQTLEGGQGNAFAEDLDPGKVAVIALHS